jgi:hypothetical protein
LAKWRSPQEKKRLSYERDRRNDYGENDKSSRKNIPRNKRAPHRANRRLASTLLQAAVGAPNPDAEDAAEQRLLGKRPKSWRKWRDAPLAAVVAYQLRRRVRLGIDDAAATDGRLRRIAARTSDALVGDPRPWN